MTEDMTARIAGLVRQRTPFVHATVVRAQEPSSARTGDQAIVYADGTIEGFVGGQCAAGSVQVASLGALESGESVLLRVLPDGSAEFPDAPGASVVVNPCLSGGALEIFLEPLLPSPLLHIVGSTPIAESITLMAGQLGFVVDNATDGRAPDGALAAIICSHGGDEPEAIRAALDGGVGYIGLVASVARGTALLDEMGLTKEERVRIHTPAGLPIGARTPAEIAVSILAEVVRSMRVDGLVASGTTVPKARQVIDPVCGMTVTVGPDTPHLEIVGQDYWFCATGCRDRFAAEH